jgi:enoyl-CoA hydratase/carnithine racemase
MSTSATVQHVAYEVSENIAEITLARPPVNAFSIPFLDDILSALRRAADDSTVRAVIVTSALPKRFCAGLDLDILLGKPETEIRGFLDRLYIDLWEIQSDMAKPTIAAVNGAARGGGMTLAISCDIILAADSATFGYPEIDLGVLPAIHFAHLPRLIGRYRAFELLFTGRSFDAREAAELGLVTRLAETDRLLDEARELAALFAAKSQTAMRLGKAAFMRASDAGYRQSVAQAVDDFCAAAITPDAQEGLKAFLEKRKPNW